MRKLAICSCFSTLVILILFTGHMLALSPASKGEATDVVPTKEGFEIPVLFEEHREEPGDKLSYLSRGSSHLLLLTQGEIAWVLGGQRISREPAGNHKISTTFPHRVRLRFLNANEGARPVGEQRVGARTSYLRGNDPSRWEKSLPNYRQVRYSEIYPGIDLVFYEKNRHFEYDFVISPSADPSLIRMAFSGADSLEIGPQGELVVVTPSGELRHDKPHVYQEKDGHKALVKAHYTVRENGVVGFEIGGEYDPQLDLTIDPVLDFSTYLGGSGTAGDMNGGVATDAEGNIYVAGTTGSTDFPVLNPFQGELNSNPDVYVTKFDSSGSVVYSTYIGGSGSDRCRGVVVDSMGRALITGTTFSGDFPSSGGAYQEQCSGQCPFVFRLSPDGSQMSYGTFIGRGDGWGIAVDAQDQAVITGRTSSNSPDFPTTVGAFQPNRAGGWDAFVSKLNSSGTALVFSTFLGGTDDENLSGWFDAATDPAGNIYVTGRTESTDFPVLNAPQANHGGDEDAYVAKFTALGAPVYSTYLGGAAEDEGFGIDADGDGNAYVAGMTESTDFPTTAGSLQPNFGGGLPFGDAFVTKIAPAGGNMVFSTYLGGGSNDRANDIVVDSLGRPTVVGTSGSANFPIVHPLREFNVGDNFVTKLTPDGSGIVYSTPGGARDTDIFVAAVGTKIVTVGNLSSGAFPILNAFQPRRAGFEDTVLAQISDAGTIYFAQFGNGEGLISDLLLTGSEASTATATVTYRDDEGDPTPVGVVVTDESGAALAHTPAGEGVVQVEVPPLGLVRVTTDGVGSQVSGSITVDFDNPVGGVIRFEITPFGTAGVLNSPPVRGFLTPVRINSQINTGVAVFNTEDHQVGYTMRLRDAAGEEVQGGLRVSALPAFGHFAMFLNELFPNVPDELLEDFEGTASFETGSANLVAATALELGGAPGEFTALPVTPIP